MKYLKNSWLYSFYKSMYHSTTFYKKKALAKKKKKENFRWQENHKIIKSVFGGDTIVRNGPFQGMTYIDTASCSVLLPKILGSYEEPIHSWVLDLDKAYKKILDIGCAEGYFAVGFAFKGYAELVLAYDIDSDAIIKARALADINKLQSEIIFKSCCNHRELMQHGGSETLIFCDIEGEELNLLDPIKCPILKKTDIIFEAHDCFTKNLTDKVTDRFLDTHRINIIVDCKRNMQKYRLLDRCPSDIAEKIIDERRPRGMKWIKMITLNRS